MRNELQPDGQTLVSIVMAAYNEEQDIGRALDSIIAQTLTDWELIIVDDGSTDSTADIIGQYSLRDSRIRLYRNDSNMELSASLNRGIELAKAELIARADADDVNLPERLSRQYDFLQKNPDVDVLGTGAYLLDCDGQRVRAFSNPLTHAELKELPFLKIPFFHPSVMIRRRFFNQAGFYDPSYPNAEDKEIWLRGLGAGCCYANLPEPLIEYSTDGFVKSWRSMRKHAGSLLRIVRNQGIKQGYARAAVYILYTTAIKLRLYKPRSIR